MLHRSTIVNMAPSKVFLESKPQIRCVGWLATWARASRAEQSRPHGFDLLKVNVCENALAPESTDALLDRRAGSVFINFVVHGQNERCHGAAAGDHRQFL